MSSESSQALATWEALRLSPSQGRAQARLLREEVHLPVWLGHPGAEAPMTPGQEKVPPSWPKWLRGEGGAGTIALKCLVSGPDCRPLSPLPPLSTQGHHWQQFRQGGSCRGRGMGEERERPRASLESLPGTDGRLGPRQKQNCPWPAPSRQTPPRCSPGKQGRAW